MTAIALDIHELLQRNFKNVSGSDTTDDRGHDAFLIEASDVKGNGKDMEVRIIITIEDKEIK